MSRGDYFDLATLITIWIVALQYLTNNLFVAWWRRYLIETREFTEADAIRSINRIMGVVQVLVLLGLLGAVLLGTIGWFSSEDRAPSS